MLAWKHAFGKNGTENLTEYKLYYCEGENCTPTHKETLTKTENAFMPKDINGNGETINWKVEAIDGNGTVHSSDKWTFIANNNLCALNIDTSSLEKIVMVMTI